MREVARSLQEQVFMKEVRYAKMSWQEHCERGRTPFRRDCQKCQEAAARGRMHRKVKHPRAGVLNLDVSGPYKVGNDWEGEAKFMLIGSYVWLRPPDEDLEEVKEAAPAPEEDDEDRAANEVVLEDEEAEVNEREMVPEGEEIEEEREGREVIPVLPRPEAQDQEERREPKFEVMKVGVPLTGKSQEEVLQGTT